ncbi:MAG: triose-phosphate isomerase [Firmicutes bacterium]|nr:triose-phosphate isomerase [Bacillota bacterium]
MPAERQKIFAANWKMYKNGEEAEIFIRDMRRTAENCPHELIIFPPSVYLERSATAAKGSPIHIGAQNIHWQAEGAYTGEISAAMAADAGCTYCLCGHSERRHQYGESAEMVARKAHAAIHNGLIPVICLGETLIQRENGETLEVLYNDANASLSGIEADPRLVVAYEPVWAIGTGRTATPEDAQTACAFLRKVIGEKWGDCAQQIRILYGGSVNPDNILSLMECPDIDGALVGGASLYLEKFTKIIRCK